MNCPDFNNVFKIYSRMAIDYSAKSTGNCILTFLCFTNYYGHPLDLCKLSFSDIKYTVSFEGGSLYSQIPEKNFVVNLCRNDPPWVILMQNSNCAYSRSLKMLP